MFISKSRLRRYLSVLLLFWSVGAFAQGPVNLMWVRGVAWEKMAAIQKTLYVQGVMDAIALQDGVLLGTKVPLDSSLENFVKGIDEHYADFRNQLIPVPFILQAVSLEITGKSESEVEAILMVFRETFAEAGN